MQILYCGLDTIILFWILSYMQHVVIPTLNFPKRNHTFYYLIKLFYKQILFWEICESDVVLVFIIFYIFKLRTQFSIVDIEILSQ